MEWSSNGHSWRRENHAFPADLSARPDPTHGTRSHKPNPWGDIAGTPTFFTSSPMASCIAARQRVRVTCARSNPMSPSPEEPRARRVAARSSSKQQEHAHRKRDAAHDSHVPEVCIRFDERLQSLQSGRCAVIDGLQRDALHFPWEKDEQNTEQQQRCDEQHENGTGHVVVHLRKGCRRGMSNLRRHSPVASQYQRLWRARCSSCRLPPAPTGFVQPLVLPRINLALTSMVRTNQRLGRRGERERDHSQRSTPGSYSCSQVARVAVSNRYRSAQ